MVRDRHSPSARSISLQAPETRPPVASHQFESFAAKALGRCPLHTRRWPTPAAVSSAIRGGQYPRRGVSFSATGGWCRLKHPRARDGRRSWDACRMPAGWAQSHYAHRDSGDPTPRIRPHGERRSAGRGRPIEPRLHGHTRSAPRPLSNETLARSSGNLEKGQRKALPHRGQQRRPPSAGKVRTVREEREESSGERGYWQKNDRLA
jgi:hypothetical protein